MARDTRSLQSTSAARVVLFYCVFAGAWILLSDRLLDSLVQDKETLILLGILKGWLFVAITGLLLYGLVDNLAKRIRAENAARERAARQSSHRLVAFIKEGPVPIVILDKEMRFLAISERWKQELGFADKNVIGCSYYEVFPGTTDHWREVHRKALAGEALGSDEELFAGKNGAERWLSWEVRPWHEESGEVGGIIIRWEDITARKKTENELRIAATAFESQQGTVITDKHAVILRVNRIFQQITGYQADEVVGKTPAILKSGRHGKDFYDELWRTLKATRTWRGEIWNRRKNGEIYPEDLNISAVVDDAGEVTNYVATFSDISSSKLAEERIHTLSFYDALTGLPNRRLLLERLKQDLLFSVGEPRYSAILTIDLDRFSLLNNTRSRRAGDAALVETGRRIAASLSAGDMVARLGSDEFAVLVRDLGTTQEQAALRARDLSRQLMAGIKRSIPVEGTDYACTACIGIRVFRGQETSADELMGQADAALHQAKQLGRESFHFFNMDLQATLEQKMAVESLLRNAVPHELLLYYQPQVSQSGAMFGVEALIRWQHPEKGIVSPRDFIQLAEETGIILPMGKWVLETACRQLKEWESAAGTRHLSIAVNVSAKQFAQADFVDEIVDVVRTTGADPHKLELELTESMLINDAGAVTEKMLALKARGIRFALDDFGTGFCSLAYLRSMPIDKLKIDQSFVADVHRNAGDAAIARMIIALGQSLGLTVIAEGVEKQEQFSFLTIHGCGSYQGFLFGRPMACHELMINISAASTVLH